MRLEPDASTTGFLAIVDCDTADNAALMFPSLEQLSTVLRESMSEDTVESLRGFLRG